MTRHNNAITPNLFFLKKFDFATRFVCLGSAGQPGGAQVSTTAEVLVVPADSQTLKGSKEDIKRKLSQLSDDDVQVRIIG